MDLGGPSPVALGRGQALVACFARVHDPRRAAAKPEDPRGQTRGLVLDMGYQECRRAPLVPEPHKEAHHLIGQSRRENEVARHRSLDGDRRRFHVTNLADHDDVGVLTHEGLEGLRERHPDPLVGLDLRDAAQVVLDRILDRRDVELRLLDPVWLQRRVQRRRLTGSGRTGHEHDAVRL